MPQPASFFDLDGTLREGYLIVDFPEYLVRKGLFDEDANRVIQIILKKYREGLLSYNEGARIVPTFYAMGLKGRKQADIEAEAKEYISSTMDKVHGFTKELVKMMKGYGRVFLISGSPVETVKPFADHFGVENYSASLFGVTDGVYDGRVELNLILGENKQIVFPRMVEENDINPEKSFAFGNTEEDFPILTGVGNGYLLNPDGNLSSKAREKGINIIAHDNVIEEVRKRLREVG